MIREHHVCVQCGKVFLEYKSNHRKFCSSKCVHASRRVTMTTPEYRALRKIWGDMKRYASKEIAPGTVNCTVDLGWQASFFIFQTWAQVVGYKIGLRFARIDKTKGYEPSNCHFIKEAAKCSS